MAKKSTRLQALQDVFEENGIPAETIENNDRLVEKIKGYADAVPDCRHPSYVKHLLGGIICLSGKEGGTSMKKASCLWTGRKAGAQN